MPWCYFSWPIQYIYVLNFAGLIDFGCDLRELARLLSSVAHRGGGSAENALPHGLLGIYTELGKFHCPSRHFCASSVRSQGITVETPISFRPSRSTSTWIHPIYIHGNALIARESTRRLRYSAWFVTHIGHQATATTQSQSSRPTRPLHIGMHGPHSRDSTGNNGRNGKQQIAPGSGHKTGHKADRKAHGQPRAPKAPEAAKARVLEKGREKTKRAKVVASRKGQAMSASLPSHHLHLPCLPGLPETAPPRV